MAKNIGSVVGALIGGALGFLTAKKYYATLSAAMGVATYPLTIGAVALALGYIGKKLYNQKSD